jgi:glycosyltransferase involved in cell wall biosynthesis
MQKIPASILIQTKNEEASIEKCLAALNDFDEIIVVDSNSTDRTAELAAARGATVIDFTWNGKYPQKKQWQLEHVQTRHPWILFLDADEFPSRELVEEIAVIVSDPLERRVAFDIPISYHFAGQVLKHGHRVVKRSLLKRDFNHYEDTGLLKLPVMTELEVHYQPEATGDVGRTEGLLEHQDLDPVRTWFDRHNRYSDWEAYIHADPAMRRTVRASKSLQGQRFDVVPFKPLAFWIYSYVVRRGFLDGRAGLDYAVALATYYWQIGLKTRELKRNGWRLADHAL